MKKTKIITSIGPASNTVPVFTKMVEAGANVARINFSHATIEEREQAVNTIKEVRKITGKNIGILYDTKGPEFRSGITQEEGIKLTTGKTIKFVKEDVIGTEKSLTFNHKSAIDAMQIGNIVLLENGLMKTEIIEKHNDYVVAKIINGGTLYSKKSCAVPGVDLKIPFISEEDKEDIIYACKHAGDYLAASFVQSAEDVLAIREILKEQNREDMKIISKIESQMGMDNLEEIINVSDGIMVARGDLGVEIPFEELPVCQKKIVKMCRKHKKIAIVATEMLESMKHNPRPTRAEVTDISYAIYNGTDAIMLSGETTTDAIMKSVAEATNSLNAKLIITPTISGKTARLISTLEPSCPILALVRDEKTANQLSLNYGVYAKIVELKNDMDELVELSIEEANKFIKLEKGDNIIVTGGLVAGKIGFTNLMKIETIK